MVVRRRWLVASVFIAAAAVVVAVLVRHQMRWTMHDITTAVARNGGVVADRASILPDTPAGSGFVGNSTIRLLRPRTVRDLADVRPRQLLVVSEEPGFTEQVQVAAATFAELGPSSVGDAILPLNVCIFELSASGEATLVDAGRINYIQIATDRADPRGVK